MPSRQDMDDWASRQQTEASFQIKEAQPDEEPITEKQLGYIKHLLAEVDEAELRQLGKWQASDLIDQIQSKKEDFTEQKVQEAQGMMRKKSGCSGVIAMLAAVIYVLIAVLR